MNKKFGLKALVTITLALGISGWNPAMPLATATPVDGNWSGYTQLGQSMSFVVQNEGTLWANFSLTIQITFPSGCTVTMTQTVNGPGTIANGQFSFTGTNFAFTGQFASDLTASGTYAFTNQPSACGTFTHSGTWSAMTPLPAPGVFNKTNPPDGATNQSVNAGGIGWTASSYVYHYEWCIDTVDNDLCDTYWTATSYTFAGWPVLEPETTYYWQVQAVNPSGTTQANGGNWFTFTTGTPPTGFNKIEPAEGSLTGTTVTFSWEPSSTAASYQICVDATDNQSCDGSSWVSTGTETSRTYSGLANHVTFYWQARAYNSGGYTDADNGVWHSFTTFDPPGPFSKDWPYDQSINLPTSLTLSWNTSAEAEYYEYCYDTSDDDLCNGNWQNAGANTTAAISGLSNSANYYWQVRAVNQGGVTYPTYDSGWWRFTTAPPLPAAFNKIGPVDGSPNESLGPKLSWNESSGAEYYQYCIDTSDNNQCNSSWSDNLYQQTSIQLNNLAANTAYFWQVRAVNGGGATEANNQSWWSFTTDIPQTGPTYSVNSTSGGKDDLCGTRHCTIRDAVSAAEADGAASMIQLQASATYILTEADNSPLYAPSNGLPIITTAITIQGNGATIQRSPLPGTPEFRFFQVNASGNLTIHNLTLQGGYLGGFYDGGGAIFSAGQLTIHNSSFIANSANNGGGIANEGTALINTTNFNQNHSVPGSATCGSAAITNSGTLTVEGSEFTANTNNNPDSCSGAINQNGLSLTVTNSVFREHVASYGSVINIDSDQNITVSNSTFDSNSMTPIGAYDSAIQVTGSTFSNNTAYASGGIYVQNSNLSVSNSTFWNNSAIIGSDYFSGGGINAGGGTVEVTNSTFAHNAAAEGGAIFGDYTTITIRNSILADSAHGENCGGYGFTPPIIDGGHNLDTGSSCNFSSTNHSLSNANPLLSPLQDNGGPTLTMALLPESPGIDAGDNAVCQAAPVNYLDQRGAPRPVDGDKNGSPVCDIGAYESPAWLLPGIFTKVSPPNTALAQPTTTILSWAPSMDAESYAYCIDNSDNGQCDTSWVDADNNLFAALNDLANATTYYWQVRATNSVGSIRANQDGWWSFSTIGPAPFAFGKTSPVDGATNQPTALRLSFEASQSAISYEFCYDTLNNNACDHPQGWGSFSDRTYVDVTGLVNNATYYWQVRAHNSAGMTEANNGVWWSFKTAPLILTKTFRSTGSQDGWMLESGEKTNKGGTLNATATILSLGDNAQKKQYRSLLSFNTSSLPDNAVITRITLKIKKQGILGGGNPISLFQGFMVDVRKGFFGTTAGMVVSDFQATAAFGYKTYGPFTPALSGGWYSLNLTTAKAYINKLNTASGLTQFRLRFKLDDNNNAIANILNLYSGNAPLASRPQLIIEYYMP